MNIKQVLIGIMTYLPGQYKKFTSGGTGATISARYCYSVWLRHLCMAYRTGLPTQPNVIAELGPGDSLGIGLAALISGADKYYAFDVVEYASNKALKQYRIEAIRNALSNIGGANKYNIQISYIVPWYDSKVIRECSVDMIYSQAVLEHVEDLFSTYEILYHWLKIGDFMSHQIDFRCHETAKEWNGHWAYSDFVWKLIKGKRPFLLNRQPHSVHTELLQKNGFQIIFDIKFKNATGIHRKQLASRFKGLSDDDLTISGAFIHAVKNRGF